MPVLKKIKGKLKKIRNKFYKSYTLKHVYPKEYAKAAKQPVDENKVVFIEPRFTEVSNSYQLLYNKLISEYQYDVHCHFLKNMNPNTEEYRMRCIDMVQDIATAKYVFLNDACNVTGCISLRAETSITQLWHGCGAFKKFGFSTAELIFGETREQMLKYPFYKNQTYITVSSQEVAWAYEEAMNTKQFGGTVCAPGVSRTDIFYDQEFIEHAKEKLHHIFPRSQGKKVILYAPTFRGRVAKAVTPNMLQVGMFKEALEEEYVLVCKHHPFVKKPPVIPETCTDFALDLTNAMSIEELLCVSDICISDYSSLIFEYSLFERPLIFYSYDLDEYFDWRGFYYDYNELTPGPVYTTNKEIIDYIVNVEERFDKEKVRAFRKKFMDACDGHATERIMQMVFGDSLEKYRRNKPIEGNFAIIPSADILWRDQRQGNPADDKLNENYQKYTANSVKSGFVCIISSALDLAAVAFPQNYLMQRLSKAEDLDVEIISYTDIEKIALAEYIIICEQIQAFNKIHFRKETKVIYFEETAFFPEKLYDASAYNVAKMSLGEAGGRRPYNKILVSGDNKEDYCEQTYHMQAGCEICAIGNPVSDIYFDEEFKAVAKKKIKEFFPEIGKRKIIAYIPENRQKVLPPAGRVLLDNYLMNEYLKEGYVVLSHYLLNPKQKPVQISKYYNNFMRNVTEVLTVYELLAIADILVGDYRKEIWTFAAAKKPMYFFAPDRYVYYETRELWHNYEDIIPGTLCENTKDFVMEVLHPERYDWEKHNQYCREYLPYCDGHVIERLTKI